MEGLLRIFVVKRLYGGSYQQTEHCVADSLVLRQFCRLDLEPVPDDTTLIRWANQLHPNSIAAVNDRGVELARTLKVTRGRKLRVDSTVVETNIDHPTDSRLLGDGVRVISRWLRRAKATLGTHVERAGALFRSRTCSVRRLAQRIHRVARRKGEQAAEDLKGAYAKLISGAEASQAQADQVRALLRRQADTAGCAQRMAVG